MKTSLIALAVILSSFGFSQSSLAQTTTTVTMQTATVVLQIPCLNRNNGGNETVTLTGVVRNVFTYNLANGKRNGFTAWAGDFTGKGSATGHNYKAEGTTEETFTNWVPFNPDGTSDGDGSFVVTNIYHLRDLFYQDNGILFHKVERFTISDDGLHATFLPAEVVCK